MVQGVGMICMIRGGKVNRVGGQVKFVCKVTGGAAYRSFIRCFCFFFG